MVWSDTDHGDSAGLYQRGNEGGRTPLVVESPLVKSSFWKGVKAFLRDGTAGKAVFIGFGEGCLADFVYGDSVFILWRDMSYLDTFLFEMSHF